MMKNYLLGSSLLLALVTSVPVMASLSTQDYQSLAHHEWVSDRVKTILGADDVLGNTRSIQFIKNNLSQLQQTLSEEYNGDMIITSSPQTKQEHISDAMDKLARYLCTHKDAVLASTPVHYHQPRNFSDQREVSQGACYRNHVLLNQEGIRYYTLPEQGTLQTIPLSLLTKLGYSTTKLEEYINSPTLDIDDPAMVYFEGTSNKMMIPVMDLTSLPAAKAWKRAFDQVKIIAYLESSQYPFTDNHIMIAIFAIDGDNLIKITTPYGRLSHDLFGNVMTMVQSLFVYSVQEGINDMIVSSQHFDRTYTSLASQHGIISTPIIKNLTHYYLSLLWQYDDQPQQFIKLMISTLLQRDVVLQRQLEYALSELQVFL